MDGGGKGCFGRRFAGGGYDKTVINGMMMTRFRPIVPKPDAGGSVSSGSLPVNKEASRVKRKYIRAGKYKRTKGERTTAANEETEDKRLEESTVVTLQLFPENTGYDGGSLALGSLDGSGRTMPIWLSMNREVWAGEGTDRTAVRSPSRTRVVESWVTVECVTDKYGEGAGMGGRKVEGMKDLDVDTCPGFVSEGVNRVKWVNQAYRRMVGPEEAAEVAVQLVVKEELPVQHSAFACRVRVQYRWQKQNNSITMPCDVWKIDLLSLAWRLDIQAALRLGRWEQ